MIRLANADLFDAPVEALVNPVNELGVMGKGLALQFKTRFPECARAYQAACRRNEVKVGRVLVTAESVIAGPRWIVHFPTKRHWRDPSRIEWIRAGLDDLARALREKEIRSVAIPALGCGAGGLPWVQVRAEIDATFAAETDIEVLVYAPVESTREPPRLRRGVP